MNVLTHGDFDERVFLHPSASQKIGTPVGGINFRSSLDVHTPPHHVQFGTPLLGREMLGRQDHQLTPASEATHSVAQLHILLENCPPEPSDALAKMCGSCMSNPLSEIKARVKRLSDTFIAKSPEVKRMHSHACKCLRISICCWFSVEALLTISKSANVKNQMSMFQGNL